MNQEMPDRKVFFRISSFQILAMFRRGLFYSYLSIYLRFFLGLSVTETTFFATFPMILNVVFQTFVWGGVSDRYQKRRTLIIVGEITAAITTVLVWFLHTLPASRYAAGYVIIIGLSVAEIFWSMSNVAWSALISDLYAALERTAVQGRLASIGALGRIAGVWIGGLAYDGLARYYEGWGFHRGLLFFIASGVMLISTIPMFFVPEGGVGSKQITPTAPKTPRIHTLSHRFLLFLIAMVLINFGRNCVAVTKTQYLVLDGGFDVSSNLLSYIVNMQSLAAVIAGYVIARVSKRIDDGMLITLGSGLACLNLLGFALARSLGVIFGSNFLAGASDVVIFTSSYTYASKLIPAAHRGKQFALFNATLFLSWGVGATLVAGPIVDSLIARGKTQVFAYRMSFLAALAMVIAGMIVFAACERCKDTPESSPTS